MSAKNPPVAIDDLVVDVSCAVNDPKVVRVVAILDYGLWVVDAYDPFEVYDCTRWQYFQPQRGSTNEHT